MVYLRDGLNVGLMGRDSMFRQLKEGKFKRVRKLLICLLVVALVVKSLCRRKTLAVSLYEQMIVP